jgi:hypothetical protein
MKSAIPNLPLAQMADFIRPTNVLEDAHASLLRTKQ